MRKNYQRKTRKSNDKLEVVGGQELLVRVPLPMAEKHNGWRAAPGAIQMHFVTANIEKSPWWDVIAVFSRLLNFFVCRANGRDKGNERAKHIKYPAKSIASLDLACHRIFRMARVLANRFSENLSRITHNLPMPC